MHLFVEYRRSSEIDKTFISLELSALKTLFLNYLYLFELSWNACEKRLFTGRISMGTKIITPRR